MMGKYYKIQLKRLLRLLPMALAVVLVLFAGLMLVYRSILETSGQSENNSKIQLAIVGDAGDRYLQMGIAAVQSFDSSRFSMEIVHMDKEDAIRALERGQIAAYVLIPDGFVDAALHGEVLTLDYVSSAGAVGLVGLFKNEITSVIAQMVIACQKGMYGVESVLEQYGDPEEINRCIEKLSISYAGHVLQRSDTYSIQALGIADALGMEDYLFCGLSVLFMMLILLPFAPLYIHEDLSLERMLAAKRCPLWAQLLCEYCVLLLGMLTLLAAVLGAVSLLGKNMELMKNARLEVSLLPAVMTVTALGYFLYSLSSSLIGGVMLQFFGGVALCFASGCLYPLYFFPALVQRMGAKLPTAYARSAVSACLTGQNDWKINGILLIWSAVLLLGSLLVRQARFKRVRG